ncbi:MULTISPECIES: hypothetical protein [Streptomyces]|uniref:hypothetical protein n=1 Tax=Streptomyces TaxID=1883 RepID=UPI00037F6B76|nr:MULTISPECIES: hypothetical protein [unclassified Streptomyces]MCR8942657.1 hypothetical protein [Streptomyces sp. OUCMDZ-4982]MYT35968.1 hypothetical protein [Streptomyces sp. SID8356]SCE41802.1 hypothetical protein GA0115244_125878 [Streptomyces sp. DvalAA-19]
MTYLHTDPALNARDEPTARERELIDAIDALLTAADPAGIIRDEAQWYLGTALEGEDNLELALPLGWDREVALRALLESGSFTVGWGGELGESPLVTVFRAVFETAAPALGEMTDAIGAELSRQLRVTGRRRLFGGASELHLHRDDGWIDLLRGGTPSRDQDLKRASHEATLRTV